MGTVIFTLIVYLVGVPVIGGLVWKRMFDLNGTDLDASVLIGIFWPIFVFGFSVYAAAKHGICLIEKYIPSKKEDE